MKASKFKAKYLAKSVGEKVGETLSIEEIENSNSNSRYYRYANESNYANNVSQSSYNVQSGGGDSPTFKKIKLRYEIKAKYRLK